MTVDRRKLFALGGLGALGAGTGALGPEHSHVAGAIVVHLSQHRDGTWQVLVPDFDQKDWRPGLAVLTKWMPLNEFLAAFEAET